MAFAVIFTPKPMNAKQYDEVLRRLEKAGAGNPPGRSYHFCYGEGDSLGVTDVWESLEQFQKFGETLMPILAELGVNPGEPVIRPLYNKIIPA